MSFSNVSHASTQDPLQCPQCGSKLFQDGQFRQYRTFTPGGGVHPSDAVWQIKICVCGHPMLPPFPPARPDANYQSLLESLHQAWDLRQGMQTGQIIGEMEKRFVIATQFQTLAQWFARLEKIEDSPLDAAQAEPPAAGEAKPEKKAIKKDSPNNTP